MFFIGFLDPEHIAVVSRSDEVSWWDLESKRETGSFRPPPNVRAHSITDDGRRAILLANESDLLVLATGEGTTAPLRLKDLVTAVTISPDGRYVAAASEFGSAKVWETAAFREAATFRSTLIGMESLGFSPDSRRLAIGSVDREALGRWDVETGQELLAFSASGLRVKETAFSSDGSLLTARDFERVPLLGRAPSWAEIAAAEKSGEAITR